MRRTLCGGGSADCFHGAPAAAGRGRRIALAAAAALAFMLGSLAAPARAHAVEEGCNGELTPKTLPVTLDQRVPVDSQPDLVVSSPCVVKPGDYYFGDVNIIKGGALIFAEGPTSLGAENNRINFWAKSIIIENGGAMKAGVDGAPPFGTDDGKLDIVLYGADQTNGQPGVQGKGALCVSPPYERDYVVPPNEAGQPLPDCGIPKSVWDTNGSDPVSLINDAPGGDNPANVVKDYFYRYGAMMFDGGLTNGRVGHFGYKVLALSYGGTLQLRGYKGTTGGDTTDPTASGTSWVRLAEDAPAGATKLMLSRSVQGDWKDGDKIIVTTTDYVPDHSEERTIVGDPVGNKVTITPKLDFPHNGHEFDVGTLLGEQGKTMTSGMDPALQHAAETRAAVALLSRSIVIESGGDRANETFEDATKGNDAKKVPANPNYAMGATTVFRQGFAKLQIDGVEFANMGVGGRMGHYPVHFHKARNVPDFPDNHTYVRDSSVDVSMTRWFVLHDTNDVELARNVGWKSIGHGYYLEDGTEANNKLFSNIGILARAGVTGPDNPRNIPGILAQNAIYGDGNAPDRDAAMYRSDILHPTIFWITNGWNELVGNMAVGAGTCGTCFWYVPVTNTDGVDVGSDPMKPETWSGYSTEQAVGSTPGPGSTPVKFFYKNYCSTAMQSLNFVGAASACNAVDTLNRPPGSALSWKIQPIRNPLAPQPDFSDPPTRMKRLQMYYPDVTSARLPTVCDPAAANDAPDSCMKAPRCSMEKPDTCATTVVDHYITSFNWSETNFAAVWMRGSWNLFDNGFISDVQNGGLTIVSGGDYSRSSAPVGYWGLTSHSVFAGYTQPQDEAHKYSLEQGPCAALNCNRQEGNTRIDLGSSIGFPMSNWATYQRLFSIYDGPAAEDANAYLNIKAVDCNDAATCMYWGVPGVRRYPGTDKGYLPNAAIGWKQPNGFYYPPAFGSRDLYFSNVDIRHFVVTPIMEPGTYRTDTAVMQKQLIGNDPNQPNLYAGYTDIDRQTVLNDEDGSLTGFKKTISVNDDASTIEGASISKPPGGFFAAPIQAEECESSVGVNPTNACAGQVPKTPPSTRTSPYDYVTTIVYPACATKNANGGGINPAACGSETQTLNNENPPKPGTRLKEAVGRGGMWSRDCAGPYCTGVKLYRQDLTVGSAAYPREWELWEKNGCANPNTAATSPQCNFPFIRMAGANEWQRNSLTANGGTYYLDTTPSQDRQRRTDDLGKPGDPVASYVECDVRTIQPPDNPPPVIDCQPRSVNVFQGGQTYYMLFLFAKKTTKQTYQIYVGDQFNPDTDVKGVRVTDANIAFKAEDWPLPASWKSSMKMISSDPKGAGPKDILQITVDFSDPGVPELDPKKLPAGQTCQPASFCTGSGSSCHCALDFDKEPWLKLSPTLKASCENACNTWAVNELDYPSIGILGFSFTLPASFKAEDQYKRPQPVPASPAEAPWNVKLDPASQPLAGSCFHQPSQIPGNQGCGVPN